MGGTGKAALSRVDSAQQRRSEFIEATIQCIGQYGIAGASIEKITQAAGVSRGLVRHYFGSKAQLLAEASQQLWDELAAVWDGPRALEEDPEAALRTIIRQTFSEETFSASRLQAWFGLWHAARADPELQRINERGYAMERACYRELLRAAAQRRGLPIDATIAGDALAALADGVWLELLVDPSGFTTRHAEEVCCHYIDLLLGEPVREGASTPREAE
jgi:TetR/AcrR family transcriptional regulator, transcriptional repressor of bet genes